jgi:hypothetical protein
MLRRNSIVRTVLVGAGLILVAGCNQEVAPPAPAVAARPGPEQSFEEIVKLFKNGMELPGSNLSEVLPQDARASSRIQVHNSVTSQLIPPTKTDEFYRGTITVSTQSMYSMRRANNGEKESDDEFQNSAGDNGFGTLEESDGAGTEFQSFDKGLIAGATSDEKNSEAGETPIVQRRPEKDDRNYELIYREGRWQLLTKLDPKTEASVANAFERALRLQP